MLRQERIYFEDTYLYPGVSITVGQHKVLVEYIKSEFDTSDGLLIHIKDPKTVTNRSYFIQAHAYVPSFRYDSYYNTEYFNIKA